jgi:hypothetical protein
MRDNLRVMGAWLASTLVWLPVFVPGLIALPSLTRYATHYPEDYLSPSAVWATISISMIMMIAGWLLMAIASQKRRGEEKITRIFAIVILAFLTIMGLSLDIGLAVLIGYVIGLTVVQHVAGRAARITLSWITMLAVRCRDMESTVLWDHSPTTAVDWYSKIVSLCTRFQPDSLHLGGSSDYPLSKPGEIILIP